MAQCKIWARKNRLMALLDYTANPQKTTNPDFNSLKVLLDYTADDLKTDKALFITGVNCSSDKDRAYEDMVRVMTRYPTKKPIVNVAYHGEQSFKPDEVTPAIAHQIGVRLAEEWLGDNFLVFVTTHLDKKHIHNHFTVCSVGLDGKRFNNDGKTKFIMREHSDRICKEYGLSIIEPRGYKYKNYGEWKAAQQGDRPLTHRELLKRDIDKVIKYSLTEKEFFRNLERLGYRINSRGKYVVVFSNNSERGIRLSDKLGRGYSLDDIRKRIVEGGRSKPRYSPYNHRVVRYKGKSLSPILPKKAKGYISLYYRYCYMFGVFPETPKQHDRWIPPTLRGDVGKLKTLSDILYMIVPNKITTKAELRQFSEKLKSKESALTEYRERLRKEKANCQDSILDKELNTKISSTTKSIAVIRKQLKLCDEIEQNSETRATNLHLELNRQIDESKAEKENKETIKNIGGKYYGS